jgi:hypothetical protein
MRSLIDLPIDQPAKRRLVDFAVSERRDQRWHRTPYAFADGGHFPFPFDDVRKYRRGDRRGKAPAVNERRKRMALEMRGKCERCATRLPADAGNARICSFECTFCADCADAMQGRCPNCGGELAPRPRRKEPAT